MAKKRKRNKRLTKKQRLTRARRRRAANARYAKALWQHMQDLVSSGRLTWGRAPAKPPALALPQQGFSGGHSPGFSFYEESGKPSPFGSGYGRPS